MQDRPDWPLRRRLLFRRCDNNVRVAHRRLRNSRDLMIILSLDERECDSHHSTRLPQQKFEADLRKNAVLYAYAAPCLDAPALPVVTYYGDFFDDVAGCEL